MLHGGPMDVSLSCYVSMPFGQKVLPFGLPPIDFDRVYRDLGRLAVDAAGMRCIRADELSASAGGIQKSALTELIRADAMIADLTFNNSNVLYDLGIRHALQRSVTLLILREGEVVPYNVLNSRILWYPRVVDSGAASAGFIQNLSSALRSGGSRITVDSPVYDLFPDINVDLPPELARGTTRYAPKRRRVKASEMALPRGEAPAPPEAEARRSEDELRSTPNVDPVEYIRVLRQYRAA